MIHVFTTRKCHEATILFRKGNEKLRSDVTFATSAAILFIDKQMAGIEVSIFSLDSLPEENDKHILT